MAFQGNSRYASPEEEAFYRRHRRRNWITLAAIGAVVVFYHPLVQLATKAVPISWENNIGRMIDTENAEMITDPEIVKTVNKIGNRLLNAAGEQPYNFRFSVARSRIRNAYAIPGGHIVIYSGLVRDLGNENELAAVMAHEIEHVLNRHSLQNLIYSNGFGVMVSLLTGRMSEAYSLLRILAVLKFSRGQEQEADLKGVKLLIAAHLPPKSMIDFFRRLNKKPKPGDAAAQLLSAHPATEERMTALQRTLENSPAIPIVPLDIDWPAFKSRCAKETTQAPEKSS